MARGWESKSIEAQQEEAARTARGKGSRPLTPSQRTALERRRTFELARARVLADLATSSVETHRAMLRRSLEAIEEQIRGLDGSLRHDGKEE
jgi:hypothetical protein